jgi:20S proteasome subunit beta 2
MATVSCVSYPEGGFSFDNCKRNAFLEKDSSLKLPKVTKTGTTICGIIYKDGVILGADTRATSGPLIADKDCQKLHFIAPNIRCAGAGTAADLEWTTNKISAEVELLRLNTGKEVRVLSAMLKCKQYLFNYQGHVSAALIMGGVDCTGNYLYEISPNGYVSSLPFLAMGSGSLAAMSVMESEYKLDMEEEDAKQLMKRAVSAGIFHDLGSGSNVDLVVMRQGKEPEYMRHFAMENPKGVRSGNYQFAKGSTGVLKEQVMKIETQIVSEEVMDIN